MPRRSVLGHTDDCPRLGIRMDPETLATVRIVAKQRDTTVAALVREWVTAGLTTEKSRAS